VKTGQQCAPAQAAAAIGRTGTLAALHHHNFRLYFAAQVLSNVGTWVQITVENWLVLQLSHSGFALGVTNALQFGPLVFLGMYGGVIADRRDRRRLGAALDSLILARHARTGLPIILVWTCALAATQVVVAACTTCCLCSQQPSLTA
jgi:hypothetical protein